jgi:hypothetical protein
MRRLLPKLAMLALIACKSDKEIDCFDPPDGCPTAVVVKHALSLTLAEAGAAHVVSCLNGQCLDGTLPSGSGCDGSSSTCPYAFYCWFPPNFVDPNYGGPACRSVTPTDGQTTLTVQHYVDGKSARDGDLYDLTVLQRDTPNPVVHQTGPVHYTTEQNSVRAGGATCPDCRVGGL